MKKYYLYGAGINCIGVIKFFGRQNIIAVIDGSEKRQGGEIEGISIISLQQYLEKNDGEDIIISAFFQGDIIAEILEKHGVKNYYISPYMQMGFYESIQDMIQKLNLEQYKRIAFLTTNPIAEQIQKELSEKKKSVEVIYADDIIKIDMETPIIVTNDDEKEQLMKLNTPFHPQKVLDIHAIYNEKYAYRNEKIKKFKNIHQGERCFIIGNGPSLKYEDLETLKEHREICFGANRIYLSYEYTEWRPDYYVAVDYLIVQNDRAKILDMEGIRFIRHFYKMVDQWDSEDIYQFTGLPCKAGEPKLSMDIYQGIYIGNTVVYDALQIALYMGFREIYLLGVDMTSGVMPQDEGAHFYKTPDPNEDLGKGDVPRARRNLGYAAKVMEQFGAKLRNATRGGELEEVERVDFDTIF